MALPKIQNTEDNPVAKMPTTTFTAAKTAWDLAKRDRPLEAYERTQEIERLGTIGEKIPMKVLNERNKGKTDLPFTSDMTEAQEQHILEATAERREKEAILENAKGFFTGGVVPFISRAVSASKDPLGISLDIGMSLAGGPLLKVLSPFAKAKKAADLTKFSTKQLLSKVARKAKLEEVSKLGKAAELTAENLASGAISEAFVVQADAAELKQYTAEQALMNVVAGAFISTGIQFGGLKAFDTINTYGKKYMENAGILTDSMTKAGKDPSFALDVYSEILDRRNTIDDTFRQSVTETFEKSGKYLDDSETVQDVMKKIMNDVVDDKSDISLNELDRLGNHLERNGGDTNKMDLGFDDPDFKLSKEEQQKMNKAIDDPKSDYFHDPVAEEKMRTQNPELSEDLTAEDINSLNTELERKLQNDIDGGALTEQDAKDIVNINKKHERDNLETDFAENYIDCLVPTPDKK